MSNQSTDEYRNADQMAFPVQGADYAGSLYPEKGLTKRELFAAMAMQGLAPAYAQGGDFAEKHVAKGAVLVADALLAALEKNHG
jgi:hypothetical protein